MLVLSRRIGERICIGEGVVVTVVQVLGNRVRLGVEAPREVHVDREEVYQRKLAHPQPLCHGGLLAELSPTALTAPAQSS